MLSNSTRTRQAVWVLGLALAAVALTFFTSWAFVIQVVLLIVIVRRLSRKPAGPERVLLLIALVLLVLAAAWTIVATLTLYGFSGSEEITSVPLD